MVRPRSTISATTTATITRVDCQHLSAQHGLGRGVFDIAESHRIGACPEQEGIGRAMIEGRILTSQGDRLLVERGCEQKVTRTPGNIREPFREYRDQARDVTPCKLTQFQASRQWELGSEKGDVWPGVGATRTRRQECGAGRVKLRYRCSVHGLLPLDGVPVVEQQFHEGGCPGPQTLGPGP